MMSLNVHSHGLLSSYQGAIPFLRKGLRLIYTSEVSGDGDGCGNGSCLRSCVNQIKETEAETDLDAKFGVLSPNRA